MGSLRAFEDFHRHMRMTATVDTLECHCYSPRESDTDDLNRTGNRPSYRKLYLPLKILVLEHFDHNQG